MATKKTTKKPSAKKPIARAGSGRTAARAADAGAPPSGTLNETAVEKAITAWTTKQVKTRADYVPYSTKALLADAREMVTGTADLPRFAELKAPVGDRDFAWLGLLTEHLGLITDEVVGTQASRQTLSREAEVAVDAVRAARTRLARVGMAAGVPATLLAIPGTADPAGILSGAERVARQARRVVGSFHDKGIAEGLIKDLEAAADTMRTVVFGKQDAVADAAGTNARRAALKRLAYDAMTRIAPWGVAAVGDDPTRTHVYRLDNLFPRGSNKGAGGGDPIPSSVDPVPGG